MIGKRGRKTERPRHSSTCGSAARVRYLPVPESGHGGMPRGAITVTSTFGRHANSRVCRSTNIPKLGRLASGNNVERVRRSEEHTSELQSLMRISYAVFCLNKKKNTILLTS